MKVVVIIALVIMAVFSLTPVFGQEEEYLDNGCPVGFPYLWSDGLCYDPDELLANLAPFVDPNQDPQQFQGLWSCYHP